MFPKESLEFVYVLKEGGEGWQEQSPENLRAGCGSELVEEEANGWWAKRRDLSNTGPPGLSLCTCSSAVLSGDTNPGV